MSTSGTCTNSLFDLSGKVFIVTGGNGGLGLGMARGLAKCGADIALVARNSVKARAAIEDLAQFGTRAIFVATDVAHKSECVAMARRVCEEFGRIDGLIANAGTVAGGKPESMEESRWRGILAVNLDGVFFSAQAVYPHLRRVGGGKVIVTGSMFSIFGCPHAIEYGVSKGAVVQLAKSLAAAWGKDNIQVNAILPGFLVTDIISAAKLADPVFDRSVAARTPAGRWGEPADLEGIAAFLCSPAANFITGAAIPADGGYSITADGPASYGET